jgi:GDPmannose 4,6-dehydratase
LAAGAIHTPRRALITGLTGQDGSFLAEWLLDRGYEVTGLIRARSTDSLGCAEHLRSSVALAHGDLLDPDSLTGAVAETRPDELYHLASPSFIPDSWLDPARTIRAIAGATATILSAVRDHSPQTRVCVAASAAMFGHTTTSPQTEDSPCRPDTPYGTAKLASHQLTGQFRVHDGLFACSAVLYNHESERRPESFVTRKLSRAAAAIKLGLTDHVELGDVDTIRDWSFAGDVVRGMWLMLQQDDADDYILASGIGHTVAELAQVAFGLVGLNAEDYVRVDAAGLTRAPVATPPVGDPSRAHRRLGWRAEMSFRELVERMVQADLQALGRE